MWRHLPIFKTLRGPTSIRIFSPLFKFFFHGRGMMAACRTSFLAQNQLLRAGAVYGFSHVVLDSRFDFQRFFGLPF
jgi:hypothetical protein